MAFVCHLGMKKELFRHFPPENEKNLFRFALVRMPSLWRSGFVGIVKIFRRPLTWPAHRQR